MIQVMQFQFFENGKVKQGQSQHTMMLEAYCEGRLNLFNPYWKRTVQLAESKLTYRWAQRKLEAGEMTAEQFAEYEAAHETCTAIAVCEDTEWVKVGRIGSKRENISYIGQFIIVRRQKAGPMECVVFLDGESFGPDRFQHDLRSKPGTGRRKAYAFYDPSGLYEAMKREEAMRAESDARAAQQPPEGLLGGDPWQ
ncbi:hypothetical protein DK427_06495 [Methylobacterium radiodurans]|uniref:Uncharacterized protein n=1 Tax=Methylobacterium radiodurans TaxID=2202828 RepID=A0A2U8VP04_9HYPH|nr:hypothetical protein DK427_06495 [Methylobacterium radiodurans]